jgi:hypothetical protein
MFYEDIVADQAGAVKRVAALVGLAPAEYRVPPPEPRENAFAPELEERRRALVAQWRETLARRAAA